MSTRRRFALVALASMGVWGCGLFDDPTPNNIFLRIDGPAGEQVQLTLARNFVAGVDELGTTRVQVFSSDQVTMTLPVDTVVDISLEQRFFVEIMPVLQEQIGVDLTIDVDDRNLFDNTGNLLETEPFRFVYVFNQTTTLTIELL